MTTTRIDEYCKNKSRLKIVLQIFAGFLIMALGDLVSSLALDVIFQAMGTYDLPKWSYIAIRASACILVTYGLLVLYIKRVLKASMTDFRMGKFNIKPGYIICAFALPAFVMTCLILTGGNFVDNQHGSEGIFSITMIALFSALKAGIIEELIFRGYIMKFLESKWSKAVAILLPSFIFGMLHITSMREFNIGSLVLLLCAGTSVGIMFSLVTYHNGSVWASALIHIVWNMAIIGRIFEISPIYDTNAAFSFVIDSQNYLLTGGGFGVEASVLAIIGYVGVSLMSVYFIKNGKVRRKNLSQ